MRLSALSCRCFTELTRFLYKPETLPPRLAPLRSGSSPLAAPFPYPSAPARPRWVPVPSTGSVGAAPAGRGPASSSSSSGSAGRARRIAGEGRRWLRGLRGTPRGTAGLGTATGTGPLGRRGRRGSADGGAGEGPACPQRPLAASPQPGRGSGGSASAGPRFRGPTLTWTRGQVWGFRFHQVERP